jgi:1D-myo-inositol 3-kinase
LVESEDHLAQANRTVEGRIRFGIRVPCPRGSHQLANERLDAARHRATVPASRPRLKSHLHPHPASPPHVEPANAELRFDYTTVGHVTLDVMANGSRRVGGTAFYSALQAARLGLRTLVLTRGRVDEIETLLAPYRDELELEILPASHTTTLHTSGSGSARSQRILAWAGPIGELELSSAILHLAPVARETPSSWLGDCRFVGLTPQGLARRWVDPNAPISLAPPTPIAESIADFCDAVVVSEHERSSCAALLERARSAGAIVAVTDGGAPMTLELAGGRALTLEVPEIDTAVDDLGAGDVFAAAFFVAMAIDGHSAVDAAAFATAAAAVRMQGLGPGAVGDRAAIEARLEAISRRSS